jgi:hypothetical protein
MLQPYKTQFSATNGSYPTALLRLSISGIPYESHLDVSLNGVRVNYSIPPQSRGENDRSWIQVPLESGLGAYGDRSRHFELVVRLSEVGRSAPVTQGGKMRSSVELIEYGPAERYVNRFLIPCFCHDPPNLHLSQIQQNTWLYWGVSDV